MPSTTVVLDTAIQVDRMKSGERARKIESLLRGFDRVVTTTMALLEFKAVVINELIIIHNQMRLKGRFTVARDALLEKNYRQSRLRAHIFNNLIGISASSHNVSPAKDELLAEKARLRLENIIIEAYRWFRTQSVNSITSAINCTRAAEAPEKNGVSFSRIPKCKRGFNKNCHVENVIRENLVLIEKVRGHDDPNDQFKKALELAERVGADSEIDLSHRDCRSAGDCLIALEAYGQATHAMSTNASEWKVYSELLGYEFVYLTYPEEATLG